MAGAAVGAMLGWAFQNAIIIEWGLATTAFGAVMLGASIGSLFDQRGMDMSGGVNYSFGPVSNTKSQLLPIPIVYGRNRVAGNVFFQRYKNDKKHEQDLMIGISEGPVHSITEVLCNDQDPETDLDDCSLDVYLNTTAETSDSRDPVDGPRPYPNGIAFLALHLKIQEKLTSTPTVTSIVEGMEVWTPEGVMYTRNPAWIIYDLLTNERTDAEGNLLCGVGLPKSKVDLATFQTVADYCDEEVEGGPRFTLDYVIDTQKPAVDHLKAMLACFRGFFLARDKIELHVDAPVTTAYKALGPENFVENSFSFWQASDDDVCNRVVVTWVNPNDSWEQVSTVFEDVSDIATRGVIEKSVSLLGVTRPAQVGRMGAYLLDTSMGVRNFCSFGLALKDSDIEAGDVIAITNPERTGWENKWFRVISVKDSKDDTVKVTCSEYVAEVYNDRALDVPTTVDLNFPTDYTPERVADLTVSERLDVRDNGGYDLAAIVAWAPADGISGIEVWHKYSTDGAWTQDATLSRLAQDYEIHGLQVGKTLQVRIITMSRLGVRGDPVETSHTLTGDLTAPGAPASLAATGGFRAVSLTWLASGDPDVAGYEIWSSATDQLAAASKVGETVNTNWAQSNLGALETRWFWVRAYDFAGNMGPYSAVVSVTTERIQAEDVPEGTIQESHLIQAIQDELTSLGSTYMIRVDGNGRIAGMALLSDAEASEFTVLADKFFIFQEGQAGDPVQVFSLADGQLVLNGSLFVRGIDGMGDGWITGDKIAAAAEIQLAAGGKFIAGQGAIVQMADGAILLDSAQGRIKVTDPDAPLTSDYVDISGGRIILYRYIGGQHRFQTALTSRETGQAISGQWKTLASLFRNQPEIHVSPKNLTSYLASKSTNDQVFSLDVEAIEDLGGGQWRFKPKAELIVAEGYQWCATPALDEGGEELAILYCWRACDDDDNWHYDYRSEASETILLPSSLNSVEINVTFECQTIYDNLDSDGGGYYYCGGRGRVSLQTRKQGDTTWTDHHSDFQVFTQRGQKRTVTVTATLDNSYRYEYRVVVENVSVYGTEYELSPKVWIGGEKYHDYPSYYGISAVPFTINTTKGIISGGTFLAEGTVNYIAVGE